MGKVTSQIMSKDMINSMNKAKNVTDSIKVNKNTVVLLGDSITYMNGSGKTESHTWLDGFFDWGNALIGQSFKCVYNAGHSGYRTDELIPYLKTEVYANSSDYVHVLAGTNDIVQNISATTIISNLKTIYDSILSYGRIVIAGTIIPNTSLSTAQLNTLSIVNNWIKKYSRQVNNIIVVDYWSYLVDGSTMQSKANTNTDGIHPSSLGAYLMGMVFKNTLQNYMKPVIYNDFSNNGNNLLVNTSLKGGTTTATSWSISGTSTPSKLVSSDLIDADYQVIQLTDSTSTVELLQLTQLDNNKAKIGDTLFGAVEVIADSVTLIKASLTIECYSSDTNLKSISSLYNGGKPEINMTMTNLNLLLKTQNFTIPSGTIQYFFHVYLKGSGTVKIRRPYLFNESN